MLILDHFLRQILFEIDWYSYNQRESVAVLDENPAQIRQGPRIKPCEKPFIPVDILNDLQLVFVGGLGLPLSFDSLEGLLNWEADDASAESVYCRKAHYLLRIAGFRLYIPHSCILAAPCVNRGNLRHFLMR